MKLMFIVLLIIYGNLFAQDSLTIEVGTFNMEYHDEGIWY